MLSEDERTTSAIMVGVAVLIWMVAYAMQHLVPRKHRWGRGVASGGGDRS